MPFMAVKCPLTITLELPIVIVGMIPWLMIWQLLKKRSLSDLIIEEKSFLQAEN